MAINIRNPEVEALLNELRTETGKGITELVLEMARREVHKQRRLREIGARRARIEAAVARYRARLGSRSETPDEIIGYDEDGLPR